jgi:hypothetical protein
MSLNLDKSSWKRVPFREAVANITDRVDNPSDAGVDRYVGLEHLDPGVMTVQRWDSPEKVEAQKLRFLPGDVIFGRRRAYQKKVAQAGFEGICSAHALVLRARPECVHPEFLPVFLSSDYFLDRAIGISVGSLSPTVNWGDLKVQQFALPPLAEQKRIADLLWAVESHTHAVHAVCATTNAAADACFSTAVSSHQANMRPLPELVDELTVGVVIRPTQYYTDDPAGIPALRGLNVYPGGFDLSHLVRFRPESAAELGRSTLRAGDVVVVRTGRPGDAAVVTEDVAGFNCIDLIITRPSARLSPEFLALYLNSRYGRAQIARRAAGTAQQHFNIGALEKLQLPNLALDEQLSIVHRGAALMAGAHAADAEAAALVTARSSLLAGIFGES